MKIQNKYWIYCSVQLVSLLLIASVAFSGSNRLSKLHTSKSKSIEQKAVHKVKARKIETKHSSKKKVPKITVRDKKKAPRISEEANEQKTVHKVKARKTEAKHSSKKRVPRITVRDKKKVPRMSEEAKKTVKVSKQGKKRVQRVSKRNKKTLSHDSSPKLITKKTDRSRKASVPKINTAHAGRAHVTLTPNKLRKETQSKTAGRVTRSERRFQSKSARLHRIQPSGKAHRVEKDKGKATREIATVRSVPITASNDIQIRIVKGSVPQLDPNEVSKAKPIYKKRHQSRKTRTSRQVSIVQTLRSTRVTDTTKLAAQAGLVDIPVDESHWSEKVGALFSDGAMRNFEDPTKNREGLDDMPNSGISNPDLASGDTGYNSAADRAQAKANQKKDLLDRLSISDMSNQNHTGEGWYRGLNAGPVAPGSMQDTSDQAQQDHDTLIHSAGGTTLNDAISKHPPARNPSSSDPNIGGTDTGDDGDDGVVNFSEDEVDPVVDGTNPDDGDTDPGDDGLVRDWSWTRRGQAEINGQGTPGEKWKEGTYGMGLGCLIVDLIWPTYKVDFSEDEEEPVNGWEYMPNPDDDSGGNRGSDSQAALTKLRQHNGWETISQPLPGEEFRVYGEVDPDAAVNRSKQRQQWASMPTEDDLGEGAPPEGEGMPDLPDMGDPPDPEVE